MVEFGATISDLHPTTVNQNGPLVESVAAKPTAQVDYKRLGAPRSWGR